jgi:hypothetical protein
VSKKSFTDGLESLFSSGGREEALETLARPKRRPGMRGRDKPVDEDDALGSRKLSGKTFALDLEAFLEDVLQDDSDEATPEAAQDTHTPPPREKPPANPQGIDALIRSTLESSEIEITRGKTKRVTFFFDERKVEALKEIARKEKRYMREVISRIVAEYLDQYQD